MRRPWRSVVRGQPRRRPRCGGRRYVVVQSGRKPDGLGEIHWAGCRWRGGSGRVACATAAAVGGSAPVAMAGRRQTETVSVFFSRDKFPVLFGEPLSGRAFFMFFHELFRLRPSPAGLFFRPAPAPVSHLTLPMSAVSRARAAAPTQPCFSVIFTNFHIYYLTLFEIIVILFLAQAFHVRNASPGIGIGKGTERP